MIQNHPPTPIRNGKYLVFSYITTHPPFYPYVIQKWSPSNQLPIAQQLHISKKIVYIEPIHHFD